MIALSLRAVEVAVSHLHFVDESFAVEGAGMAYTSGCEWRYCALDPVPGAPDRRSIGGTCLWMQDVIQLAARYRTRLGRC